MMSRSGQKDSAVSTQHFRAGAGAAMTTAAEFAAYRERLWAAASIDNAASLESGLWEVVVAEVNAGRTTGFRRVLLQALDVSSVAQRARIGDLVQRYARYAEIGSTQAAVLLGAMLCFHATGNSECAQDMARQGFIYLETAARGGNVLGLLLYGLAAEAGRGTQPNIMRAHQAYKAAAEAGDTLGQMLMHELLRDVADAAGVLQEQQGALPASQAEGVPAGSPGTSKEPAQRTSPAMMPSSPPQSASAQQRGLHRSHSGSSSGGSGGGHPNSNSNPSTERNGAAEAAASDKPQAAPTVPAEPGSPADRQLAIVPAPGGAQQMLTGASALAKAGGIISPFEAAGTRHLSREGAGSGAPPAVRALLSGLEGGLAAHADAPQLAAPAPQPAPAKVQADPAADAAGVDQAGLTGAALLAQLASAVGVAPLQEPGLGSASYPQLLQAFDVTVSGLDAGSMADYVHNLGVLCSEAPRNDMVILPVSYSLFRAPSPRPGSAFAPTGLITQERADSATSWTLGSGSEAPGQQPRQSRVPGFADSPGPPVAFNAGGFGGGFGAIGPKPPARATSAEPFGGAAPGTFNAAPGRSS
ncbi:hypothetical protein WJX81_003832 [Elliptochloris bilobata]|uniref:Uncharacterized protein n=1 Tax=Elliptochloris bilobata TaxID=381761 RepID=A0AAW1SCZ9_9CHLO